MASSVDHGGLDIEKGSRPGVPRWSWALLVGVAVASGALYAVRGVGFVLDDWWTLRGAHAQGMFGAADSDQLVARPGAWLVNALVFGGIGRRPLAVLAVQSALMGGVALTMFALFRRLFDWRWALVVTLIWQLTPNHTSLEVWASAVNITLGLLGLLAGALVLTRSPRSPLRIAAACALLVASVLCYEATAPAALLVVVGVPWIVDRRPDLRATLAGAGCLALTGSWIVVHWHPAKPVARAPVDLSPAFGAHFGWGLVPGVTAQVLALVVVAGLALAVARLSLPSFSSAAGLGERLVVAGVVVVIVGVLPFAFYLYAPLGFGDRATVVSGVGGAMVIGGIIEMVHRWRAPLAWGLLAMLAIGMTVVRVERVEVWSAAGRDAEAILAGVQVAIANPPPGTEIVFGPAPIQQDGVAAFLDSSNIESAVQLVYDDPSLRARFAFDEAAFEAVPRERRFDIRAVSELVPDIVVRPSA
jgi:hypothetical protein